MVRGLRGLVICAVVVAFAAGGRVARGDLVIAHHRANSGVFDVDRYSDEGVFLSTYGNITNERANKIIINATSDIVLLSSDLGVGRLTRFPPDGSQFTGPSSTINPDITFAWNGRIFGGYKNDFNSEATGIAEHDPLTGQLVQIAIPNAIMGSSFGYVAFNSKISPISGPTGALYLGVSDVAGPSTTQRYFLGGDGSLVMDPSFSMASAGRMYFSPDETTLYVRRPNGENIGRFDAGDGSFLGNINLDFSPLVTDFCVAADGSLFVQTPGSDFPNRYLDHYTSNGTFIQRTVALSFTDTVAYLPVPEPGSLGLLLLAVVVGIGRRRGPGGH